MQLLINNWGTSLALAAAIGDATIAVDAPSAARLVGLGTGDYYLLTLAAVGSDGVEAAWEIVKVTGVAGGVLSVVRGQEGTTARAWTALSHISARVTKGTLDGLRGASIGNAAPLPLGVADPGEAVAASREDHVHQLPDAAAIGAIASSEKGAALGVATLDAGLKIPLAQLPATAITDTFVVASQSAMLALTAQTGDVAIRTDISSSYILRAEPASTLGNWQLILTPAVGGGAAVGSSVPHALGSALPGVSGYASREDHVHPMPSAADVGAATPADLATKVDKVTGKGLSTEDYTTGEKSKLSGVAVGATANSTDSALRDRSSHTGTQAASTISDFTEAAQDAIAALLVAGSNITLSYNDAGNLMTISAAVPQAAVVPVTTTARVAVLADAGAYLRHTNAAASTYTVAPQSDVVWPVDAEVHIRRAAGANLTLTPGVGVTLNPPSGGTLVLTNAMSVTLKRVAADVWDVIGQTVAA